MERQGHTCSTMLTFEDQMLRKRSSERSSRLARVLKVCTGSMEIHCNPAANTFNNTSFKNTKILLFTEVLTGTKQKEEESLQ